MNEPSIEEAKKDLEVIEGEIILLRLIADSARELSTHDDIEAWHYRNVSAKSFMHLESAEKLKAHIKLKYNL